MTDKQSLSYADCGVDIDAGNAFVGRIKQAVNSTMRPEVLSGLGGFGGLFKPDFSDMEEPVLVSGTDGVGTKLLLLQEHNRPHVAGIDAVGVDISEFVAKNQLYITHGDVTKVKYPEADLIGSFDILEHLTKEGIDKVLDKCKGYPTIFHSISISDDDYGDVTFLKDMDKTHISMYSSSWWMDKIYKKFSENYYITVMTRKDYIEYKKEGYKFTNLNFLLTKDKISDLQII